MLSGKYFIIGGDYSIEQMFHKRGWSKQLRPDEETLIVFTGGEDVSPEFYGEAKHPTTGNNLRRDEREIVEFHRYREHPKVGICRGGQFLNVMSGGRMWQNVDGHAIFETHNLIDLLSGEEIPVTSTHHQMMRPSEDAVWIATAKIAKKLETADEVLIVDPKYPDSGYDLNGDDVDVWDTEVIWYDDTNCLCFQPHPEYEVKPCEDYFFDCLGKVFA